MPYQRAWQVWILLASYVFYGWWDWRFVFLLAGSTLVNHVLAVAIHRARRSPRASAADPRARVRPRAARLLQVRELLPQLGGQPVRAVVDRARRPARRDLLLHVHGDLVRRRRLPRRSRARLPRPLRRLPGLLPAPRRRPDRPRERAAAPARAPRDPRRVDISPRVLADRRRPVPEGRDRQPPRDAHRRRRLRGAEPALVARGARRASTAMPFRSSPTSAATRTSRSASRSCSGSSSRRTSTRRTPRSRCRTSGGAGT